MSTVVRGKTITLSAQYVNAQLESTVPTDPSIDIINPQGVTVVNNDTPTAIGISGYYEYEYAVAGDAPVGTWTALWHGYVDGDLVEATGTFNVVVSSSGIILDPTGCPDNPQWASPDAFAVANSTTLDEAAAAIEEATWVLSALTQHRFHGAECRQDVYRNRPGSCIIDLEHWPVDEVQSVFTQTNGETPVEVTSWRHLGGNRVRICCTGSDIFSVQSIDTTLPCHSCRDQTVIINYRVKSNLPPGVARVTNRLALEFHKASTGASCALPERITTVNRQGMTWTILDPLDFLDQGLTGIGPVDQWIAAINGKGGVRLTDPLTRPPLVSSSLAGCGELCGEEDS